MLLTENYKIRLQELAGIKSENLITESFAIDYVKANYLDKKKVTEELYNSILTWDRSQNNADLPIIFKFIVDEKSDANLVKDYVQKFYTRDISRKLKNITQYKDRTFVDFTRDVDDAAPITSNAIPVKIEKKQEQAINGAPWIHIEDKPIFQNNKYIIFHPDPYEGGTKERCILYGGKYKYCVSRFDSASNMYTSYRKDHDATLYFIFDKNLPESDPNHVILIDVKYKDEGYLTREIEIKNGDNRSTSYGDTLESFLNVANSNVEEYNKIPASLLVNKPKTKQEKETEDRIDNAYANNKFLSLNYEDKETYIEFGYNLSKDFFLNCHPNLQYKYISLGRPLEKDVITQLSTPLKKNYLRILQKKFDNNSTGYGDFDFDLAIENNLDLTKVNDTVINHLATYNNANRVFMYFDKIYERGLSSTNLYKIYNATRENTQERQIIIKKLLELTPQDKRHKFFLPATSHELPSVFSLLGEDYLQTFSLEEFNNIFEDSGYGNYSDGYTLILTHASKEQIESLSKKSIANLSDTFRGNFDELEKFISRDKILASLSEYTAIDMIRGAVSEEEKVANIKLLLPLINNFEAYYLKSLSENIGEKLFIANTLNGQTLKTIIESYYPITDFVKNKKGFFQKIKKLNTNELNNINFYRFIGDLTQEEKYFMISTIGEPIIHFVSSSTLENIIASIKTPAEKIVFFKLIGRRGQILLGEYFVLNMASTLTEENKLKFLLSLTPNTYHGFFKSAYELERLFKLIKNNDELITLLIHLGEKNIQKLPKDIIIEIIDGANNNETKLLFIKKYKDLLFKKLTAPEFKTFLRDNEDIIEGIFKIYGGNLMYKFDSYTLEDLIRELIPDKSRVNRWINYLKIGRYYQQ